jgi:hypothetical protein
MDQKVGCIYTMEIHSGIKQGTMLFAGNYIECFLLYVESTFEKRHEIKGVVLGKRYFISITERGQEGVTGCKRQCGGYLWEGERE